jgi:hypothetical protein
MSSIFGDAKYTASFKADMYSLPTLLMFHAAMEMAELEQFMDLPFPVAL